MFTESFKRPICWWLAGQYHTDKPTIKSVASKPIIMNIWWSCASLIFSSIFLNCFGLESPPQLECLENAMRLHFVPDQPAQPFAGHVYLKGFFFSTHCHLDYSHQSVAEPFYMHIPYRSECQVKRERSIGQSTGNDADQGQQQSGLTYSIVVIVQHHRLFVTNRDKAYSVTCFYRDARREFERRLDVNDLAPMDVTGGRGAPTCQYEVLHEGAAEDQQESVRFANIGEVLIHRWSCDTEEMGMLVHSCTVRDGLGHSFTLLDQRGCVTDSSLVPPLTYAMELNKSSAAISTFKFADQMIVYFRCQITLCDKRENGCEGITPPVCQLVPLPSEGGPAMHVQEAARDVARRPTSTARQRARHPVRCCQHIWQPLPTLFGRGAEPRWKRSFAHSTRHSNATESIRRVETRHNVTMTGERGLPKGKAKLITVDVVTDGLIVFTRDEGLGPEERNRLVAHQASNVSQCQNSLQPLWALTALALLPVLLIALVLQRHLLQKRIKALSTFTPSFPVEMSGFPSAFGQSPLPKPRQYGRL